MENKPAHIALADHIRSMGLRKQDFAKIVGVRSDHLSRWLSGTVRPERPTRKYIAFITNGSVGEDDWG